MSSLSIYDAFMALGSTTPETPTKWTYSYLQKVKDRLGKITLRNPDRLDSIVHARSMPEIDDIAIGSGKYFPELAVLFLDICNFSCWSNWLQEEQANVLQVINIFMATMQGIIRDFDGTCEKNTGDGLMAYFSGGQSPEERARTAVHAATVMCHVNDYVVTPELAQLGIEPVTFRVGIDTGPVTIARVGVHSDANQFVAIGTSANIACKLMRLVEGGGICVGEHTYTKLSASWRGACQYLGATTFHYVIDGRPYPAWKVGHQLSAPYPAMLLGGLR
jgi:class 3 adenylate cyclase